MHYRAPLEDLDFLARELIDLDAIGAANEIGIDIATAVWEEAGRFAESVLLPLNAVGDRAGLKLEQGVVTTPPGFSDAYSQLIENAWNAVAIPESIGGQGLPLVISSPITEMFSSANKAFNMCPGLSNGAIEAIAHAASDDLKAIYLPKMVSGEWTGTMNLTEPQAGSDLSALKTRAVAQADGSYLIKGQKIFISFGEHDMAENIIHLVLARTPDAPAGVRGISLFLVPKFLVNEDGSLGERNDLLCTALEHKVGIHASPTCVMSFGEKQGAKGFLVGELNAGLMAMFVMMNNARLAVGIEGVASAEAAYQHARAYAFERIQGTQDLSPGEPAVIADHADVQRMLVQMQAQTRAMRSMAMVISEAQDKILLGLGDPKELDAFVGLMTPIFKAWATETGVDVASLGIQIHGGSGYVEETGAAQIWRDSRISPIYEGTTGIQANDLIGRKLVKDGGATIAKVLDEVALVAKELETIPELANSGQQLRLAQQQVNAAVKQFLNAGDRIVQSKFVSVPFLMACGNLIGGWLLGRAALKATQAAKKGRYSEKIIASWLQSAQYFCAVPLAQVYGYCLSIEHYLSSDNLPVNKELL